jgi:phosphoglycerate dehydrogenase-like enzyme
MARPSDGMRAVYVDVDPLGTEPGRGILEAAGFEVQEATCREPAEVIEAGAGAAALLVGFAPVTREVLEALPSVGIVSTASVGTDHVDLEAAGSLGVWVCNVPDAATDEVATHALAMALSLVRELAHYQGATRRGAWLPIGPRMRRPTEMTLGVVGMGRIGRRLAEMARPVFGTVLACDPFVPSSSWPDGIRPATLDAVFAESDVVSLHVPLADDTRCLVDRERLRRMRPGSYLVNVSRGGLVDHGALVEALDAGRISGAALDVLPTEPPDPDDPILRHPRVLVTPHVAYLSDASAEEYSRRQAHNVVAWAETGTPEGVVVEPARARVSPR